MVLYVQDAASTADITNGMARTRERQLGRGCVRLMKVVLKAESLAFSIIVTIIIPLFPTILIIIFFSIGPVKPNPLPPKSSPDRLPSSALPAAGAPVVTTGPRSRHVTLPVLSTSLSRCCGPSHSTAGRNWSAACTKI
jgi:hypothetical protein